MESSNKAVVATPNRPPTKHKRRFCKVEGCQRIVKSQGLCQRHGAKPCKCRVPGCGKQAQGNFQGMCKAHFRQLPPGEMESSSSPPSSTTPGTTKGKATLCKTVVPDSPTELSRKVFAPKGEFPLSAQKSAKKSKLQTSNSATTNSTTTTTTSMGPTFVRVLSPKPGTAFDQAIPASIAWNPQSGSPMPLIALLQEGYDSKKASGWHRTQERTARGLAFVPKHSALQAWEMELLFVEILVLTGQAQTCFRYLAHAWGQAEGFHLSLGKTICRGRQQDANEVSEEEESEAGSSQGFVFPPAKNDNNNNNNSMIASATSTTTTTCQRPTSNSTVNSSSHDIRTQVKGENHNSNNNNTEQQRSPLETLIALLASTK